MSQMQKKIAFTQKYLELVFLIGLIMKQETESFENELEDLKKELEHFQQEKERVRAIIGKIGGVPKFRTKLINTLFIVIIVVSVAVSIFSGEKLRLLMIELATITLSIKIIYLIHCQMRVNHFEFWILSSLEWRLTEMMKHIKEQKKGEPGPTQTRHCEHSEGTDSSTQIEVPHCKPRH